jgi:hypothetical protein
VNFGRRLPVTALATVVVGVLGLSACGTSTPSNRRMAEDIIETVEGLTDDERACMLETLEENYSSEDLEAINEENKNVDWDAEGATGGERWQAFVADLESCRDGATDASAAGSSDVESSAVEGTETADSAAESTEADDTEPAATTEPGSR